MDFARFTSLNDPKIWKERVHEYVPPRGDGDDGYTSLRSSELATECSNEQLDNLLGGAITRAVAQCADFAPAEKMREAEEHLIKTAMAMDPAIGDLTGIDRENLLQKCAETYGKGDVDRLLEEFVTNLRREREDQQKQRAQQLEKEEGEGEEPATAPGGEGENPPAAPAGDDDEADWGSDSSSEEILKLVMDTKGKGKGDEEGETPSAPTQQEQETKAPAQPATRQPTQTFKWQPVKTGFAIGDVVHVASYEPLQKEHVHGKGKVTELHEDDGFVTADIYCRHSAYPRDGMKDFDVHIGSEDIAVDADVSFGDCELDDEQSEARRLSRECPEIPEVGAQKAEQVAQRAKTYQERYDTYPESKVSPPSSAKCEDKRRRNDDFPKFLPHVTFDVGGIIAHHGDSTLR